MEKLINVPDHNDSFAWIHVHPIFRYFFTIALNPGLQIRHFEKKLKSKKNSKLKRKTQEFGNICLKEEKNEYASAPKY